MENKIIALINRVKELKKIYIEKNIDKESFVENDEILYYSVILWGSDDKSDLSFYIEYYKKTETLLPIICITRKYKLVDVINLDSVGTAIDEISPIL